MDPLPIIGLYFRFQMFRLIIPEIILKKPLKMSEVAPDHGTLGKIEYAGIGLVSSCVSLVENIRWL